VKVKGKASPVQSCCNDPKKTQRKTRWECYLFSRAFWLTTLSLLIASCGTWVSLAQSQNTLLIHSGTTWKYLDNGSDQSTPAAPVVTRGPYLQMGNATSIVVRWRTDSSTNSRVLYGTSQSNLNMVADDLTLTTEHEIRLDGLSPDTTYFYSVGTTTAVLAGNDGSQFFATSPPIGMAKPTRIWVLGDSGTADANARSVRDAYLDFSRSTHTNLWLMLGDNAYENGTDSDYQAAVFNMYPSMLKNSVLWPTIGNHDTAQATNPPPSLPYYSVFTLPAHGEAGGMASGTENYYSFDYGNIHFICLDSMTSNRSPSGPMMTWLRNDLSSTLQQWIIAYWHHPPYSKGSHDSDTESELIEMRQYALPILESYGVDLVLCGHSHSYERSFLIDGHYGSSSTFTDSMKKNGGDGRIGGNGAYTKPIAVGAPHEGAVYAVAGSSGQISGGALNHRAMFISLNALGSMVLDVNGDRLDAKFLTSTGAVGDFFTIRKGESPPSPGGDVVLYASESPVKVGDWQVVPDITAAGGARIWNPNRGAEKINDPLANPSSYFEAPFYAQSNTAYRLWIRGKSENNSPYDDSVFLQFSDTVDSTGVPAYRIGSASATTINLEDCSGCGLSGWGWQDNGWGVGVMGPLIYFQASGPHTLRVQPREDGLSIDQIVLSPQTYLNTSPGSLLNDNTILARSAGGPTPAITSISPSTGPTGGGTLITITGTGFASAATVSLGGAAATNVNVASSTSITATTPAHGGGAVNVTVTNTNGQSSTLVSGYTYSAPPGGSEVVLYASEAPVRVGNYSVVADPTAAGGSRMFNPDAGAAKLINALASPSSYFEMTFTAQAGTPYHLWIRGKAQNNDPFNDSIFVQFSDSVTSGGAATSRIGTTSSETINLEECSGCGLSGWGWQDNGWGVGVMGPLIYFQSSGTHTLRIQPREDGLSIDQIALSAQTYLNTSPGTLVNDSTILPRSGVQETVLLADDFNGNSLDISKWASGNLFSGFVDPTLPVVERNQRLEIGPLPQNLDGSHYNGIRSVTTYDFTGAYCYVQLTQSPLSTTSGDAMLTVGFDGDNYYRLYVEAGILRGLKKAGGVKTSLFAVAYDPAQIRYLRVRHDPQVGKVRFEAAADAGGAPGGWVQIYNEAWDTSSVPLTNVIFELKAGTYRAESNAPGTVAFDSFKSAKP
jgi:Calcineurin-like phosphoesterase/IPT/TIG domain/Purple acid Phosphatase, N-terminal domain